MDKFLALRASTSSNSAEQLAFSISDEHGEGGTAVQAALQLRSIADVQRWLDTHCRFANSADCERLREAVNILAHPKPRKEDIRKLQSPSNWNVAQKVATKPRPLADVIEDLKRKVLEAACAIQTQLTQSTSRGSAEQPASARSSTTQQSKFEHSDGPAAQDFFDFPENPVITHLRERQKKRKASAAADEAPRVAADGDAQGSLQ